MKLANIAKYNRKYETGIFKSIQEDTVNSFYTEAMDILKSDYTPILINNDIDYIRNLIKSGRIFYSRGFLYIAGGFIGLLASSKIKRVLGVKYDRSKNGYKINIDNMPYELRLEIYSKEREAQNKSLAIQNLIMQKKETVQDYIFKDNHNSLSLFIGIMGLAVLKTLKNKSYTDISELEKSQINYDAINRVTYSVRYFQEKRYNKLLKQIISLTNTQGITEIKLKQMIEKEIELASRHNKIIANNEANIILALTTQAVAIKNGKDKYIWKTMGDERVRPLHRQLNGTLQSFSNPPVADDRTGERANPGLIYNCRCRALVVLD